jgi:hypothetical protein
MTKNEERLQQWLDQPEPPPQPQLEPEQRKPRWVYAAALIGALLAPLALFLWMTWGHPGGVAEALVGWAAVVCIVFILAIGGLKRGASR